MSLFHSRQLIFAHSVHQQFVEAVILIDTPDSSKGLLIFEKLLIRHLNPALEKLANLGLA